MSRRWFLRWTKNRSGFNETKLGFFRNFRLRADRIRGSKESAIEAAAPKTPQLLLLFGRRGFRLKSPRSLRKVSCLSLIARNPELQNTHSEPWLFCPTL